jgi:hypothetical protein
MGEGGYGGIYSCSAFTGSTFIYLGCIAALIVLLLLERHKLVALLRGELDPRNIAPEWFTQPAPAEGGQRRRISS